MTTDLFYIVSTLQQGGPTNQLYYIIRNLDRKFNITLITLSPEPDDTDITRFQELDITLKTLGLSRLKGMTIGAKRLRNFVERRDPDIIQTQGIRADTLSAALFRDYHRVTTIRNYPYRDYTAGFGAVQGRMMAWEHVQVYRRIENPIACSKSVAATAQEHGVDATPIQNGVDHQQYKPVRETDQLVLRDRLGIDSNVTVFISVGKLIERKDPKTLIRGFSEANINDSRLLILGDGPLRSECECLINAESNIELVGWVENVAEYLQASDYFVSASHAEGLPNSVMEAIATGLPVCLSDIDPHREILADSECGQLFNIGDENALREALQRVTDRDYVEQSEAAREIGAGRLSADRMADEYQQLYREILQDAPG